MEKLKKPVFVLFPRSAVAALQDGQEGQVGAAQVRPPPELEHVADRPGQLTLGVVQRAHGEAVGAQLQDQGVAPQQQVVPAQRHHLHTHLDLSLHQQPHIWI